MKIITAPRDIDDAYTQLVDSGPFARAVNAKLSQHWVNTGTELSIMTAILEVLADTYDEEHPDIEPEVSA